MFRSNCIDENRDKFSEDKNDTNNRLPDMEFWRSLVEKPGCEKDGVCNNCGLCEH